MNAPFLQALADGESFVLTGHERPDGDCLGAAVALYHLLVALGKEVRICNPDPAPASLDFLAERTPIGSIGTSGPPSGFDPIPRAPSRWGSRDGYYIPS